MKFFPVACAIFSCLLITMSRGLASAEDHVDDALNVSKGWVGEIDAGQYDKSYDEGCDAMHDKVKQTTWGTILSALRTPWGSVTSRRQVSHIFKPNGYEGTSGEFMVITYETTFKKLDPAMEVVVLKWDGGQWRGAGYNAGPKDTPDNGSNATASSNNTETHTEAHMKPVPQVPQ
jgi:hypothetical protein